MGTQKKGFETISKEVLAERGVAQDPITHLANGNFNNSPSDEVNDYIEQKWAEYTIGG